MITLFWCPRTRAMRSLWMLEECNADYELVKIDIRDETSRSQPNFLAVSPMGKVPAIRDGEIALADSTAIALYLAERFPDAGLAPAVGDPKRAAYHYWTSFMGSALEPAMAEKFSGMPANRHAHAWGDFDLVIKTLEAGLEGGPWLLGEKFSAADVLVGSTCNFMRMFGIMPEGSPIGAYIDRCLERPAFKRAMAKDTADV